MVSVKGAFTYQPKVTAIIPAHNEETSIATTIASLKANGIQDIFVILDSCTDNTGAVADEAGAVTIATVDNEHKKAGALNYGIRCAYVLSRQRADFYLMVDADTELAPGFMEAAMDAIVDGADCVGGIFKGHNPKGLLELCQHNEYARYAREVDRTRRVMVLTGAAALLPARAIMELLGDRGMVYHENALTEDMELTLALKKRGYRLASPQGCECTTELMPTVGDLMRQRVRWYRGAIENLFTYGLERVTRRYWFQQLMLTLTVVSLLLYFVVTALSVSMFGFATSPLWLAVTALFITERVVTVWKRGTVKGRILAALLIPEMIYSSILLTAFVRAWAKAARKTEHEWAHVER